MADTTIPAHRMRYKDITGQVFGRLIVLEYTNQRKGKVIIWKCKCACGQVLLVNGQSMKSGNTKSCGCLDRESRSKAGMARRTHRKSRTSEHRVWTAMRSRCMNKSHESWASYGGRGITVCDRWFHFENFLADMGPRPRGTSLDRINNEGGYSPDNCRWATRREQQRNQRGNKLLTFQGETLCLIEWEERTGISSLAISTRIKRGWSIEDALTVSSTPRYAHKKGQRKPRISHQSPSALATTISS